MRKRKAVWLLSGVLIVMIAIAAIVVVAKAKPVKPIDGEISLYVAHEGTLKDYYVYIIQLQRIIIVIFIFPCPCHSNYPT